MYPSPPQEVFAEGDESCLFYVAKALMALQATHGTIPHVKGKGTAAAAVHRIMGRMRRELGQDAPGPAGERLCVCWYPLRR